MPKVPWHAGAFKASNPKNQALAFAESADDHPSP